LRDIRGTTYEICDVLFLILLIKKKVREGLFM
jgi:hypothetical protein